MIRIFLMIIIVLSTEQFTYSTYRLKKDNHQYMESLKKAETDIKDKEELINKISEEIYCHTLIREEFAKSYQNIKIPLYQRYSAAIGSAVLSSVNDTFEFVFKRADKMTFKNKNNSYH